MLFRSKTEIYATIPAGFDPCTHKPITARALVNLEGATSPHFICILSNGGQVCTRRENMKDIEPVFIFDDNEANASNPRTPAALAHKAIYNYHLSPSRVLSALLILEQGRKAINPQKGFYIVQSDPDRPRYAVTTKSCSCPDSDVSGNICKHRIAVWMYEKQNAPMHRFYQFQFCPLCNQTHWLRDGETCEGKDLDPLTLKMRVVKTRTISKEQPYAEIELAQV